MFLLFFHFIGKADEVIDDGVLHSLRQSSNEAVKGSESTRILRECHVHLNSMFARRQSCLLLPFTTYRWIEHFFDFFDFFFFDFFFFDFFVLLRLTFTLLLVSLVNPMIHMLIEMNTALQESRVALCKRVLEATDLVWRSTLVVVHEVLNHDFVGALRGEERGERVGVPVGQPSRALSPCVEHLLLVGRGHFCVRVLYVCGGDVPDALHLGHPLLVAHSVQRFTHGVP